MKTPYFRALTIAGSDNSGGAGIQADLKTFSALGCYGMSVITALTAQNTKGVRGIQEVEPSFIEEQIHSILDDIGVDAIKIGMLFNIPIIKTTKTNNKDFFDIKKIYLLQNNLIGARETHRIVLEISTTESWRMTKPKLKL